MTFITAKSAWFFAWAILCLAALPSGVEVRHLAGVVMIGLVVYFGRGRIFKHRPRGTPISYPITSFVLVGFATLGAWTSFGLTFTIEQLCAYRPSVLVLALGLTGFLVLDWLAGRRADPTE